MTGMATYPAHPDTTPPTRIAVRKARQLRTLKRVARDMAAEQLGGRGQSLDAFLRVLRNGDKRRRFLVPRQAFQRRAFTALNASDLGFGAYEAIADFCRCCASTVRQNVRDVREGLVHPSRRTPSLSGSAPTGVPPDTECPGGGRSALPPAAQPEGGQTP